jgi:hypothetical protein
VSNLDLETYLAGLPQEPDGFKMTLVYWGREPVDDRHPIHQLLEMLRHQFELQLKKQDVVVMNHRFWQADMIWAGGIQNLVSTAKEMDTILQQQLPQMPGKPEFNFDTWNYPPAAEDDEF